MHISLDISAFISHRNSFMEFLSREQFNRKVLSFIFICNAISLGITSLILMAVSKNHAFLQKILEVWLRLQESQELFAGLLEGTKMKSSKILTSDCFLAYGAFWFFRQNEARKRDKAILWLFELFMPTSFNIEPPIEQVDNY